MNKPEVNDDEAWVRAHCPNAVMDKLFEADDVTYDWAVFDALGSLVYGSGKTQEEAWRDARLHATISGED